MLRARLSAEELGPVFSYPYGQDHSWDVARYREQVPKTIGPAFPLAFTFSNDNEHVAALTQSQIQDVWWLHVAAQEISSVLHPVYFVPRDAGGVNYYALVKLPAGFQETYRESLQWFFSHGPLQLALRNSANIRTGEVKWDACVETYPAGISELCNHKVDDKLVLSTRRPHGTETKGSDFGVKVFESGKMAIDALQKETAY